MPTEGYPDIKPKFKLRNPRGLDDKNINKIEKSVKDKLDESIGQPVVFDLIEVIREHLTESNLPSGQCVVCLYGFQEGDQFTKTDCYHYLHSYCLARHLLASKKNYQEEQDKLPAWQRKLAKSYQAFCPVCREIINDEVDCLLESKPPAELENAPKFQLTVELKNLQTTMTGLFLHQKSRGGIIDLDADDNNVILLENENDREGDDRKNCRNDNSVETPTSSVFETPAPTNSNHHHHHHRNQQHQNQHTRSHSHNYRGSNRNQATAQPTQSSESSTSGASGGVGGGGGQSQQQQSSSSNHHNHNYKRNGNHHRSYARNRRGVHNQQNQSQGNGQQPCSSNPR